MTGLRGEYGGDVGSESTPGEDELAAGVELELDEDELAAGVEL
jgi:hypothetical protein